MACPAQPTVKPMPRKNLDRQPRRRRVTREGVTALTAVEPFRAHYPLPVGIAVAISLGEHYGINSATIVITRCITTR